MRKKLSGKPAARPLAGFMEWRPRAGKKG